MARRPIRPSKKAIDQEQLHREALLAEGSEELSFGRMLLEHLADAYQKRYPGQKIKMPSPVDYRTHAWLAGKFWYGKGFTPAAIVAGMLSTPNAQWASYSWMHSSDPKGVACRVLESLSRATASAPAGAAHAYNSPEAHPAYEEVRSALEYAQAMIRARHLPLGDPPSAVIALSLDIGGVEPYIRCVLCAYHPDIMRRYGSRARNTLIERGDIKELLEMMQVNVQPIMNHAER